MLDNGGGVSPACTPHAAAGMGRCAAHVEPGSRRAVARPAGQWSQREHRVEFGLDVHHVAADQAELFPELRNFLAPQGEERDASHDRRKQTRSAFRVQAALKLFTDCSDEPARILYTRDANHRGIGFVTRARLPLGYGGILELPSLRTPGKMLTIQCTLSRCRLAAAGWYEGALHFNRDQWEFLVENACEDFADEE